MSSSQFNFKSSGVRTSDRRFTTKKTHLRPIGIKTPLALENNEFKTHKNPIRQLSDNFRNLMMTNKGERLGRFNFGANLTALVYEYSNSPQFEEIISESIIQATQEYIPTIAIQSIDSNIVDVNEKKDLNRFGVAKVSIRIQYTIPKFNSPLLGLEINLNVGG